MIFLTLAAAVVVFFVVFGGRFGHNDGHVMVDLTKQMVCNGGVAATQLECYRLNTGHYPASLKDLTTRPADPVAAARWGDEPYIKDANSLMDPWANLLQYRIPGVHNVTKYDLWSMGRDGVSGTADDIGNW